MVNGEEQEIIYLDHAATTAVRPEVLEAMIPLFSNAYANASAVYSTAGKVKETIAAARRMIAEVIGAKSTEIYFTSGGSESDNWALRGAFDMDPNKNHIITTQIEHHAILETCKYLEKHGAEVTYLPVDENGIVDPAAVEAAIRPETCLISVMMANNEIGTIEPIVEIGEIARAHGVLFHTDAVQMFGHLPINVERMNIDLMSASAHKLGGPKGTGMLYIRRGINFPGFILGGGQERGRRAGTENAACIAGFAAAAQIAETNIMENIQAELMLSDRLTESILTQIQGTRLNGSKQMRLPNNVNITFDGCDAETMLMMLDMEGICASGGSACSSGSLDPSHVLTAIGLDRESAASTLRFTVGAENTEEQIDMAVEALKKITTRIRRMRQV